MDTFLHYLGIGLPPFVTITLGGFVLLSIATRLDNLHADFALSDRTVKRIEGKRVESDRRWIPVSDHLRQLKGNEHFVVSEIVTCQCGDVEQHRDDL